MDHMALGIDDTAALIAQEVEGAGLGDIAAAVAVGGIAGGVVCQRIERTTWQWSMNAFLLLSISTIGIASIL